MDTRGEYRIFHTEENLLKSLLPTLPATFVFIHLHRLSLEKKPALLFENINEKLCRKKLHPIYFLSSGEYSAPFSPRTPKLKHSVITLAYIMTSPL